MYLKGRLLAVVDGINANAKNESKSVPGELFIRYAYDIT
jgi:hypothetical protein